MFPIFRPTLKKCSFPIHRPDEKKIVTSRSQVKIFLESLWLKRYVIKRFTKISNWYNKNVSFYISIFSFYVQLLCWFIVISWWLVSVKVLSCVPIQIKQTNISIFFPILRLTVSFADPLWFACTANEAHKRGPDDKVGLFPLIK